MNIENEKIQFAARMKALQAKVLFKRDPGTDKDVDGDDGTLHGEDFDRKTALVKRVR